MGKSFRWLGWISGTCALAFIGAYVWVALNLHVTPSSQPEQMNPRAVELGTVELDLQEFNKLSPERRKEIYCTIDTVSAKYKIPPMLMHLVCRIESGYNFWIEHPEVTVLVNNKHTPIRATGLGGVVWEFWSDTLKKAGIAQARSDLFMPAANLRATGLILGIFAEKAVHMSNEENVLPVLISKYYGQFDKNYETLMVKYSSDLFWKRISRELFILRNVPQQHKDG